MTLHHTHLLHYPLNRNKYFEVLQAGLAVRKYTFVRQAVLNWLATYPGDLQAGLYYSRALAGDQHFTLALQVLQGLCTADPEFLEAVEGLLDVIANLRNLQVTGQSPSNRSGQVSISVNVDPVHLSRLENSAKSHYVALKGGAANAELLSSWGGSIWLARQALEQGDFQQADKLIEDVINQGLVNPLIGVAHLHLLSKKIAENRLTQDAITLSYHQRWPDTLYFMLSLAERSLDQGQSDFAVALLHQAASRDVAGQVVRRMWGECHPFRSLWPETLQLKMTIMVPAVVMARLGWNRLSPGNQFSESMDETPSPEQLPVIETAPACAASSQSFIDQKTDPTPASAELENQAPSLPVKDRPSNSSLAGRSDPQNRNGNSELRLVEKELERLAARFKLPGVTRQDGRFPVYVIFSVRCRLQSAYGPVVADLIESEMEQLAIAVRSRPGWGAMLFFGDDPSCTMNNGSKPARPDDPWELKLVLADLDNALAKRGERIGALLIVGGPEIVPFHRLPNPVDDQDSEIPSDNPYAARDKNYFIPEWPVGRLPGGMGSDARLILNALRRYQTEHRAYKRKLSFRRRLVNWASEQWKNLRPSYRRSFGYTAEIWRQAAGYVFQPIGRPAWMKTSPPSGVHAPDPGAKTTERALNGVPAPVGKLGYFNLHGLVDASEWFGHRDLLRPSSEPDYPIALRPEDICPKSIKGEIPRVIFSEACYGAHLQGRKLDDAICLKFLDAGSLAYVGSTCMAYGAVTTIPMVAADLLGYTFWRFLKQGLTAGEALRQAKIYLASEMDRRQSYLDGEDQKTLISFILYGDPLAEPVRSTRVPRSVRYQDKSIADVRTICDRLDSPANASPVPAEVMDGVRRAVAKYLPGMSDARVAYACEHPPHDRDASNMAAAKIQNRAANAENGGLHSDRKFKRSGSSYRSLVTLSKQVARQGEIHPEIARLTLDDQGHLVKLVVSR